MRILGIDPGSATTGYGVIERAGGNLAHRTHGVFRLSAGRPLSERLGEIHRRIDILVRELEPDIAAVERVFVAASPRSALVLGQARGAALAALGAAGIPVAEYAPPELKQAVTGSGRASKREVQAMVKRLLGLMRTPASDAADALALAICHAHAGRLTALGVGRGRSGSRDRARGARHVVVRRVR
jgi:crossover junction endodeoxyribonuclease RuvC